MPKIVSCIIMMPQCVVMTNGDSILVVLHGDEYVSWYETDDGLIAFRHLRRVFGMSN